MGNLKRLLKREEQILEIEVPVNQEELNQRKLDYPKMKPIDFAKKSRNNLFRPTKIHLNGQVYEIQVNHCTNPYCKWFGLTQTRFENVKSKPYRYKLGSGDKDKRIVCNPDPTNQSPGISLSCSSTCLSNWSVASEIQRLCRINKVTDIQPDYQFHKEGCPNSDFNPFDNPQEFYNRGKSSSNSPKKQCKTCKKITNLLPKQEQSFSYNQQRNDILPTFAKLIISRTPVRRVCEILGIGSQTYYNKLEWLYRRCIEFNERYETRVLEKKSFPMLWIDSDQLIYNLNNIKRRGHGGDYDDAEDPLFPTHVIVSADVFSRYVFRADVAYDFDITLSDVTEDTLVYKEDHLYEFSQKNARLRFPYCPQQPTSFDTQAEFEYLAEKHEFDRRNKYLPGIHVNSTYTAIAHFWLLHKVLKAKEWRLISDEDRSLMTTIYRVFSKEILEGKAHHLLCKIDHGKSRNEAFKEAVKSAQNVYSWGQERGYTQTESLTKIAKRKLEEDFQTHKFYSEYESNGQIARKWAKNPIVHPLPTRDKGDYSVDCTTDVSNLKPWELAEMVFQVNNGATSAFMQQIRRRLSTLERPLVTARPDGKSYIYANVNPKYAQYEITILRTLYNFCWSTKRWNELATPAQRLGLTDKQFSLNDILYFK